MTRVRSFVIGTSGILSCVLTVSALSCLSCPKVYTPRDCARLEICQSNQACSSRHYTDSHGTTWYSLGCSDLNTCNDVLPTIVGKRNLLTNHHDTTGARDHDVGQQKRLADSTTCHQCCNDSIGCNKHLCGATASRNLVCMSCKDVRKVEDCDIIHECGMNSYCYIHTGISQNIASFDVRYDMGCLGMNQCNAFKAIYPQSCVKCCNNSDFCNYAACDGWKAQLPNSTTPTTPPSHITSTKPPVAVTQPPHVVVNGPDKGKYMTEVELRCVSAPPAQSYQWKFNVTKTLPQGVQAEQSSTNIGSVAGTDTLTIPSLTEKSFGTYICVANINGHVVEESHSINIIEERPTVQIVKPPVTNSFALQCKSTGYPVPHIEWDFLPSSIGSHGIPPGVQFNYQGSQSTLFVYQYRPSVHDGIWICKATNSQGGDLDSVRIP